jgi:hypothetical protein
MWTKEKQRASAQKWYYKDIERSRRLSRERVSKRSVQNYWRRLERVYGLTDSGYSTLLYAQGNRCAICRAQKVGGKANQFHVDHNHKTNEVRGLLCNNCNAMVGYAKDSPKILESAIAYLLRGSPLVALDQIVEGL